MNVPKISTYAKFIVLKRQETSNNATLGVDRFDHVLENFEILSSLKSLRQFTQKTKKNPQKFNTENHPK